MTNKLKALVLLPFVAVALTACTLQDLPVIGDLLPGGGGTPEIPVEEPVSLKVWGLWEDPSVVATIIERYNENRPNVTVNYDDRSVMQTNDYKARVFTQLQTSTDNDIFLIHTSWLPRISSFLAPAPEGTITAEEFSSEYYPAAVQTNIVNNQVYGIPAYYDGLVLVYNKEHFNEIGQQTPPVTWVEFRGIALELTVRGGEEGNTLLRGGAAIGTENNVNHFSDILGLMWSQAGVSIPADLRSDEAADALDFYTNFVKEDRVWDRSMPDDVTAFVRGEVSMIFVPSWQILTILNSMPNIDDVGVASPPQADPSNPASWGSFWVYVVPANTPNAAVAWDYLMHLHNQDSRLSYYSEATRVRAFGPPYPNRSLASEVTNDFLLPVITDAEFSTTGEIAAKSGNKRQVDALRTSVNAVLDNSKTPSVALSEAFPVLSQ